MLIGALRDWWGGGLQREIFTLTADKKKGRDKPTEFRDWRGGDFSRWGKMHHTPAWKNTSVNYAGAKGK